MRLWGACRGLVRKFSSQSAELMQGEQIHSINSKFNGQLQVFQHEGGIRELAFGGGPYSHGMLQSLVKLGHPETLLLPYLSDAAASLALLGRPLERALIIGLGGGSMPMYLRHMYPDAKIDVIELCPEVVQVARSHFELPPDNDSHLSVHTTDATEWVRSTKQQYDLVFQDAVPAGPHPLLSIEFQRDVDQLLAPGALFAHNTFWRDADQSEVISTLQSIFRHVYMASTDNNKILVGVKEESETQSHPMTEHDIVDSAVQMHDEGRMELPVLAHVSNIQLVQ